MSNNDEKDKKIIEMLRKAGKLKSDYPENLYEKRREGFIRQLFLNKYFWLIVLLLFIIILCILYYGGTYTGQNTGVYLGNFGFEIQGNPGFFYGNY